LYIVTELLRLSEGIQDKMIECTVTVKNKLGLHARPATTLVKKASRFKSDIFLIKDGQQVNAKSIMGVMSLTAERGSRIKIVAQGEDEELAIKCLVQLFEQEFEEEEEEVLRVYGQQKG